MSEILFYIHSFFYQLMLVDSSIMITVISLTAVAGFIVHETLKSDFLTALFVPGLFFGSLLSLYLFREFGVFISSDQTTNMSVAAGAGMFFTVLFVLVSVALRSRGS